MHAIDPGTSTNRTPHGNLTLPMGFVGIRVLPPSGVVDVVDCRALWSLVCLSRSSRFSPTLPFGEMQGRPLPAYLGCLPHSAAFS